jgi:hypothetical protein
MKVKPDPRDVVLSTVVAEHRPFEDSIQIVREKRSGKDAAFAVSFEDRDGVQRRGLIGLCHHHGGVWQPSGGFIGSARVVEDRDVWMTWGGWGPATTKERAAVGGWLADPSTAAARLVDPMGRVLEDVAENGVVIFMWKGDFDDSHARLELLDEDQRVIRTGPMRRSR